MRKAAVLQALLLLYCAAADDLDQEVMRQGFRKTIRAMTNQTKADSLNLPSNATSIRENITDSFSCENRTYGYYADVDNDCQLFHVCLPSRSPSGRSATYRWSFICPEQTVFNQEVLVCTRPKDSIDCMDSPMYYDVNMDIGKTDNDSMSTGASGDYDNDKPIENSMDSEDKPVEELPKEIKPTPPRKRNKIRRGRSRDIIVESERVNDEERKNEDTGGSKKDSLNKGTSRVLKSKENNNIETDSPAVEKKQEKETVIELLEAERIEILENERTNERARRARIVKVQNGARGAIRFQADIQHE